MVHHVAQRELRPMGIRLCRRSLLGRPEDRTPGIDPLDDHASISQRVQDGSIRQLTDDHREPRSTVQPCGNRSGPLPCVGSRQVELGRPDPERVGGALEALHPGGQGPDGGVHGAGLGHEPAQLVDSLLGVVGQILCHHLDHVAHHPLAGLRRPPPLPQVSRQSAPGPHPGGPFRRCRQAPHGVLEVPLGRTLRGQPGERLEQLLLVLGKIRGLSHFRLLRARMRCRQTGARAGRSATAGACPVPRPRSETPCTGR